MKDSEKTGDMDLEEQALPGEDVSRLTWMAGLVGLAVFVLVLWPIARAVRAPLSVDEPQAAWPEPEIAEAPMREPVSPAPAAPMSVSAAPADGEFITDYQVIRQREEAALETIRNLREQAADNPETGLTEEQIQQIHREGGMIM